MISISQRCEVLRRHLTQKDDASALRLTTDAELLDEILILGNVLALEVVEEVAAVLDLAKKAVTGAVVLLVRLEVLGEGRDFLRENRDLDFGRARVRDMAREFVLDGGLVDLDGVFLFTV